VCRWRAADRTHKRRLFLEGKAVGVPDEYVVRGILVQIT
jgi:hypothetical protein